MCCPFSMCSHKPKKQFLLCKAHGNPLSQGEDGCTEGRRNFRVFFFFGFTIAPPLASGTPSQGERDTQPFFAMFSPTHKTISFVQSAWESAQPRRGWVYRGKEELRRLRWSAFPRGNPYRYLYFAIRRSTAPFSSPYSLTFQFSLRNASKSASSR